MPKRGFRCPMIVDYTRVLAVDSPLRLYVLHLHPNILPLASPSPWLGEWEFEWSNLLLFACAIPMFRIYVRFRSFSFSWRFWSLNPQCWFYSSLMSFNIVRVEIPIIVCVCVCQIATSDCKMKYEPQLCVCEIVKWYVWWYIKQNRIPYYDV
jgi:hypothetical protein